MKSLAAPDVVDELIARVRRLGPASERRWGTMSVNEMLCHVADSYRGLLGEHAIAPADTVMMRTLGRWIALHTNLAWPKGIKTRPEVDPRRQGTKPGEFERDREAVVALIRRFAAADARYAPHPMFGRLSRQECLTWGYRHPDHHLRQFGV